MKTFQDTVTGEEWSFDDLVDVSNLVNVPKTLTDKIVKRPTLLHDWVDGVWVLNQAKQNEFSNAEILSSIAKFEEMQKRPLRELMLDAGSVFARQKLADLNLKIDELRKGLK